MVRILLIDDNRDDRLLARRELEHGMPDAQITEVGDEAGLTRELDDGHFDLVVTDYLLRWSDGLKVLRAVKDRSPECPVIMFTNSGNEEIAAEAMKAGLDDYILKRPAHYVRLTLAAQAALERAVHRRAAHEALEARERFLTLAAHEIRTPLTIISVSLASAARGLRAEGQSANALGDGSRSRLLALLERAQRQVRRLDRLQDDLEIAAGTAPLTLSVKRERVDLQPLVRETIAAVRDGWDHRAIELDAPRDGPLVVADASRVEQVLTNMVVNAVKFSPPGQPVHVSIQSRPGARDAWIGVTDLGPGIPEEQQPQVWERYYRVPGIAHRSGSSVGLGFGLYVSRLLVEEMHGAVGVESNVGEGATFWFTLPLAEEAAP